LRLGDNDFRFAVVVLDLARGANLFVQMVLLRGGKFSAILSEDDRRKRVVRISLVEVQKSRPFARFEITGVPDLPQTVPSWPTYSLAFAEGIVSAARSVGGARARESAIAVFVRKL
jgi:hypothetical protein